MASAQAEAKYNANNEQQFIIVDSKIPLTFPFLSVTSTQRAMFVNAYTYQMALFGGTSATNGDGTSGEATALYYLGVFATMVGALLIVFFPKYQNPPTIFSWLLVVAIVVFAPYGSKLLFYPTMPEHRSECGKDSSSTNGSGCGFTPQLAAFHLATTLQVVFSDFFRSNGWVGIIESAQARVNLRNHEMLTADADWYHKSERVAAMCRGRGISAARVQSNLSATSSAAGNQVATITLGEVWDGILNFYQPVDGKRYTYAPEAIRLFSTKPASFTPQMQRDYETGFLELYKAMTGENVSAISFDNTPAGGLSMADALAKLKEDGFFNSYSEDRGWLDVFADKGGYLQPGFFFTYDGDDKDDKTGARIKYADPHFPTSKATSNDYVKWHSLTMQQVFWPQKNQKIDGGAKTMRQWEKFKPNLDKFTKMPVGLASPYVSLKSEDTKVSFKESDGLDCDQQTALLAHRAINVVVLNQLQQPQTTTMEISAYAAADTGMGEVMNQVSANRSLQFNDGLAGLRAVFAGTGTPSQDDLEVLPELITGGGVGDTAEKQNLNKHLAYYFTALLRHENIGYQRRTKVNLKNVPDVQRNIMLRGWMEIIAGNTSARINLDQNTALSNAAADAEKVTVVGTIGGQKWLSTVVGWGAQWAGKGLLTVGASITGGVALAIVHFLSILVDLSLMALIILTPVLLMAGIVIPSSAAGVLSITVIGAFVLKFVPITLMILNNLGGMMMDVVSYSRAEEMWTMQNMLILGINGMYAALLTMTFFLLFKLGDPAAVLGRMTALDGAAKEMAESGRDAAVVAAGIAASAAFAGATGGLSAGAQKLFKGGANAVGMGQQAADLQALLNKAGKGAAVDDGAPPNETPAEKAKREAKEAEEKANAERAAAAALAGGNQDGVKMPDGFSDSVDTAAPFSGAGDNDNVALAGGANDNRALTGGANDNRALGANDNKIGQTRNGELIGIDGMTQSERDAKYGIDNYKAGPRAPIVDGDYVYTPDANGDHFQVMTRAAAIQQGVIDGPQGGAALAPGAAAANTVAGSLQPGDPNALAGGGNTTQATGPVNVLVAGGTLDEIKSGLGEGSGSSSVEKEVDSQRLKEQAGQIREAENVLQSSRNVANPTAAAEAIKGMKDAAAAKDDAAYAEHSKNLARAVTGNKVGTVGEFQQSERQKALASGSTIRGMMNKYDQMIADMEKNPKRDEKELAQLRATRASLDNADPLAFSQKEYLENLQDIAQKVNMQAVRLGGDVQPGFVKGMLSGFVGSMSGNSGALGKIPILGPALTESLNEWRQAPERARAWQAAGGIGAYYSAAKKAERLAFYQKAITPIAAGHQYDKMLEVGAFQAQVDMGRQAASEAVARNRSGYEAMLFANASAGKVDINGQARGYMEASELRGLGLIESTQRIQSVRAEALVANGGKTEVQTVVKDEKTGEYKMKNSETKIDNNIAMFTDIAAGAGAKRMAGTMDDMMRDYYGVFEKRFGRTGTAWDGTANISESDEAMRTFARLDVDSDYLVSGHLKMVQGKEKFYGMRGEYSKLVELRNREANEEIKLNAKFDTAQASGDLASLLKGSHGGEALALRVTPTLDSNSKAFAELRKDFVKAQLKVDGSMTPIFEVAQKQASAKYELKSQGARLQMREADEKLQRDIENLQQSYAKTLSVKSVAFKGTTVRDPKTGLTVEVPSGVDAMREHAVKIFSKSGRSKDEVQRFANAFMENMFTVLDKKGDEFAKRAFDRKVSDDGTVVNKASKELFDATAEMMQASNFYAEQAKDVKDYMDGVTSDIIDISASNPGYRRQATKNKKGEDAYEYVTDEDKFKDADILYLKE